MIAAMKCNAIFIGSGFDYNGVACRYYIHPNNGTVYRAYDTESLDRAAHKRLATQPVNGPTPYHKIRKIK